MNKNEGPMVNVTGLWTNTDRNNEEYMAGNCGSVRYWVFKNKNKKTPQDPDYLLKISQNIKKPHQNKPIRYGEMIDNY